MEDRPWFFPISLLASLFSSSLNAYANCCIAYTLCYSIRISCYFLCILRAIRCLHFSLMPRNYSSPIVNRWRATLPRLIAMKKKPSLWRVSGSTIKSVKHHRRYVNRSKVTSLKTSNRLALVLSRGMYQSTYIREASAEKLRSATCTHRNSLAPTKSEAKRSLLVKNKVGSRIRYYFAFLGSSYLVSSRSGLNLTPYSWVRVSRGMHQYPKM